MEKNYFLYFFEKYAKKQLTNTNLFSIIIKLF